MYRNFLGPKIVDHLLRDATPVAGVPGLQQIGPSGGLETAESLRFLVELCRKVSPPLMQVLQQRERDRDFIDQRTRALYQYNQEFGIEVNQENYRTVLGLEDQNGRIVVGPLQKGYWRTEGQKPVAPLPDFLKGPHVTLFGPPDNAKMCVNAMNAYHRQLKGEPEIVRELLATHQSVPKWGADDEDSKTPIREDLIAAGQNLTHCFRGDIHVPAEGKSRAYQLEKDKLSLPIKRFPGLALPTSFLFLDGEPLPLHLYDFALHLFANWQDPRALVFYVPKLENEEEAQYIHDMIDAAEAMIQSAHSEYRLGTVRLMIVLENPRAVFRTHEIMDALHPYFAGASLGWHDFLASAARLFREDGNYRIPIKADPDIVIKYIKASHELLAQVVGPRGGIKVGGMYGILPLDNDLRSESFQITIKGYIRDVITQMKRELDGFWVAHPDFVRLGLALVEAWQIHARGDSNKLRELITALLEPKHQKDILDFTFGPDIESLDPEHPRYARALIVADLKQSAVMPNNDESEIRYNVFQSLQYLADWLSGNGCVALPTQVAGVAVRVMDDLATAERSRWEVWHEIHHGRFKVEDFLRIAFEEMRFIRKDLSDSKKIVQVKWDERSARWYPTAFKLMVQLMTSEQPVEFATELLLPFTMESVRSAVDPWALVASLEPKKYRPRAELQRYLDYFEICGHGPWAKEMSKRHLLDIKIAESLIRNFALEDLVEAASFHGNIGESPKALDARAAGEQAGVTQHQADLLRLGGDYLKKFGIKFLISAQGQSGEFLLAQLKSRLNNSAAVELDNAREALWQITRKRLLGLENRSLTATIEELQKKHGIKAAQIALCTPQLEKKPFIETLCLGEGVHFDSRFQLASLSKPIATAFASEFFPSHGIALTHTVQELLEKLDSPFRLKGENADRVTLEDLMRHQALNLHYVNGVPPKQAMPPIEAFLDGNKEFGYEPVQVIDEPGERFHYSGGGFLVLQHLVETLGKQPAEKLLRPFLDALGMSEVSFDPAAQVPLVEGQDGTHKMFPAFAAGALGTAHGMLSFLTELGQAFSEPRRCAPLSHDTAVEMLFAQDKGSVEFMGARMGRGIFVLDAGSNKIAVHQGANDGYRCLFLHCFIGPQRGYGFVALCNGELNGVRFISEVAQALIKDFGWSGVRTQQFAKAFDESGFKAEEIVNRGYKELLFQAFEPNLPEAIVRRGPRDPLADKNLLVGSQVLEVSNEIFARAVNLLSPQLPVFEVDLYGEQGKVMDSWESARHSRRGFEDLVLELKTPSPIRYAAISTAFHNGNQVPELKLEAFDGQSWHEILPRTKIEGHALRRIELPTSSTVFQRVRIVTYPDGGLTRLGLYAEAPTGVRFDGKSEPWPQPIPAPHKPLVIPYIGDAAKNWAALKVGQEFNNASAAFGARIVRASNEHYSPASQLLSPLPPLHMFDGFESARSRERGHFEECVIALAKTLPLKRIEVDFTYFVNNNPRALRIEGFSEGQWVELVPETSVKAFAANTRVFTVGTRQAISELKLTIIPDGGINRLRAYADR